GRPLTGNVAECEQHSAVAAWNEIVVITADLVARERDALKFISVDLWRPGRLKPLLYLGCKLEFALHSLAFDTSLRKARILDANGCDRGEGRQNIEVLGFECCFVRR